jgi:hypothetical protein
MRENEGYKKKMTVINKNAGYARKNIFLAPKRGFSRENGYMLCVCDWIFYKFE